MADIENTPVEQLCYTWSDVGLSTVYAGFRIRAASPGLTEIYSERVKSMDRYMRYVLPPGTDRFAITTDMAPVCLAFVRTEWGEYILVHKNYVGEDGVGRLGNFFIHLFAFGPEASSKFSSQGTQASEEFSAQNAIWFWESDIWKTSDQQLDRRSNQLTTVLLGDLYDYQRFRPNYTGLQRPLSFVIEAYLMRQPEQQIYIAAPASSTATIATLITGLTDCLPRQLLAGLTFSTYEPDVTKATAQIVGTSWIPTAGAAGSASQVFAPSFYHEKLVVNCFTGDHSPLQGHPLTVNNQTRARLAPQFARYAAECLVADNVKALFGLIEQAERDSELTIESFLLLYESEIRSKGTLSQEVIESYLGNPIYQLEKLSDPQFRESILKEAMGDPQWEQARLHPLLANLQKQSRKPGPKKATVADTGQKQQKRVSAQEPPRGRKRKGVVQHEQPSLTLADALALLARNAIPRVVSTMAKSTALEETAADQDAVSATNRRKYMERISALLGVMDCCLPPEDPTGVWKDLLDSILEKPGAYSFLRTNWDFLAWLLQRWDDAFTGHPECDEAIRRLLVVPWSHLGEFLKLHLRERHGEWNVFVVEELSSDTSLTPQITRLLGQSHGEEIDGLLEQMLRKEDVLILARAAEFTRALISNGYPGKPKYYRLIEQLLEQLINVDAYWIYAKDLVGALTLNRYSGTPSYWIQVETLLRDLIKGRRLEDGMNLFHTLASNYDKERFAPIVLQANLGLVKQVYPTPEEQASFFVRNGSQYLSTPEHLQTMLKVYLDLLPSPGRPQRLVVLLGAYQLLEAATREKFVLTVLNKTSPDREDRVAVLKTYGKQYLQDYQQSPQLAKFVIDSYRWLVQTGYPAKELLFALFTSAANPQHLEMLLASAPLSGEDSAEFFKTYGSLERYFPFFYQSSTTLTLLTKLAQTEQFSAIKMQVVLSWLDPSNPHRLSLKQDYMRRILQAAALTPAEQQQFLERYGQTYLPLSRQLPIIVEYLERYIFTFTADALDRMEAKRLVAFLWRIEPPLPLDPQIQQRLGYWGTINQYFEAPTANPGVLNTLAAALESLGLPNTSAFEGKLAAAFAQCVEQADDLAAIMQHVEWIPKLKSNSIQLLYSIAEERAKQYRGYVRDVLPCIMYVLNVADPIITPKRQEHFTQQFLDRLLCHMDDLTTWDNLNRFVTQQGLSVAALNRWRSYLDELKLSDKVTSSQDTKQETVAPPAQASVKTSPPASPTAVVAPHPTSPPSWLVELKGTWDYAIATIQMGRFKNVTRMAKTWERYQTLLSPDDFPQKKWEKIDVAYRFVEACRTADQRAISFDLENTIVQLASQINKLSLKYTPSQEERIILAQRRLQAAGANPPARGSSRPLPEHEVRLQGPNRRKRNPK